jgi:hypothetical protein
MCSFPARGTRKENAMFAKSKTIASAVIAAGALALAGAATAATDVAPDKSACFFISQWRGWKAPASDVLYLGVNGRGVFRVGLAQGTPLLQNSSYFLVWRDRPTGSICQPVQINLALSDGKGLYVPLIAKSLTRLSPEEVAAIPKRYRPN